MMSQPLAIQAELDADAALSEDAARLAAIIDAGAADVLSTEQRRGADSPGRDASAEVWATLPGSMQPAEVRCLIERTLADPSVTGGPFPGLTAQRLRPLLEPGHRPLAAMVLAWLDQAGLLEAPASTVEPFRHPRALRSTDLEQIVAHLARTPVPDRSEVAHPVPVGPVTGTEVV